MLFPGCGGLLQLRELKVYQVYQSRSYYALPGLRGPLGAGWELKVYQVYQSRSYYALHGLRGLIRFVGPDLIMPAGVKGCIGVPIMPGCVTTNNLQPKIDMLRTC